MDDKDLVNELQPFMIWAGRFPFPKNENEVIKYEEGIKRLNLNENIPHRVEKLIKNQVDIMK